MPASLQDDLLVKKQSNQLSIYGEGRVSAEILAKNIILIKKAFPRLTQGWFDVLEQMLDEYNFTDERLNDATKNLIVTCQYPEPTISNLLSYDQKIEVYTYDELLETSKDYSPQQRRSFLESFGRIDFYGEERYARKEYIKALNLKEK